MAKIITKDEEIEIENHSDLVTKPLYESCFNDCENEQEGESALRVLSLFSDCGGMDIGLEGGFII